MARSRIQPKSTDAYFAAIPEETRATAIAVRDVVRRAAPDLVETMCMGIPHWAGKDYVLYIADYTHHVNLGFRKGAQIRDTTGRLEGTGKGLRHVKVRVGEPVPAKALAALIRKAIVVDRG